MRSAAVGFLLGMVALFSLPALPDIDALRLVGLLGAAALAMWRPSTRPVAFCLLGLLHAHAAGMAVRAGWLPPGLEGETIELTGRVADLPVVDSLRVRFEFEVDEAMLAGRPLAWGGGRLVRLSWYRRGGREPPALSGGERLRLDVRLKRPRGLVNPAGFDYERWLFSQRLVATGYVLRGAEVSAPPGAGLTALRARIADRLARHAGDTPRVAMLEALTIGSRRGLSDAEWDSLRATGTGHLVAISGLHVGMLALLGYACARRAWTCSAHLTRWLPAPRAAALAALLLATVYAALAGFTLPTQRALVMVAVAMLAVWSRRSVAPGGALATALFLVLLLDPLAPLSAGFWLSFAATAVLLFLVVGRRSARGGRTLRLVGLQAGICLGLAPVALATFGLQPLLAPLANLVAIPWTGWVIVPAALAGAGLAAADLAVARVPLAIAGWAAEWLLRGLELLTRQGDGLLVWREPSTFAVLAALVGAALLLAPRGLGFRSLGILWMLPLWLPAVAGHDPARLRVAVLDVGQGLAGVVSTANHTLVYDTGPRHGGGFDSGRAILLPYLRRAGVERVDVLILSHANADHTGGAAALLSSMPVARVLHNAPREDVTVEACAAGDSWTWDGYAFRILHPAPERAALPGAVGNDDSCVLHVDGPGGSALLTGDIEAAGERALLASGADIAADLVVVPHHGSRTSSTQPLVDAVGATLAVFATGHRNRYGFPVGEVARRWRRGGATLLDTAPDGALLVDFSPAEAAPVVRRLRHERAAPWRAW